MKGFSNVKLVTIMFEYPPSWMSTKDNKIHKTGKWRALMDILLFKISIKDAKTLTMNILTHWGQ